jgi:hypothetical protein
MENFRIRVFHEINDPEAVRSIFSHSFPLPKTPSLRQNKRKRCNLS